MNRSHKTAFRAARAGLITAMLLPAVASAVPSFNFDAQFGASSVPMNTFGGDAGQPGFWNGFGAGPGFVAIMDLSGVPTGVTARLQLFNGTTGTGTNLTDDFITGGGSTPWSFELFGLGTSNYDIWFYASDTTATGAINVSVGGGGVGGIGSVAAGTSGVFNFNLTSGQSFIATGTLTGHLAGVQVRSNSTAVPEPSTLGLLGLAVVGVVALRRRRLRLQ